MKPDFFKLIATNLGKFIFLNFTSVFIFIITVRLGQIIFIYFSHCLEDCVIETFSSIFIFGLIIGLIYLYFLIKGIKKIYLEIHELKK